MKFSLHTLVLTLSLWQFADFVSCSSSVVKCRELRRQDNENSLGESLKRRRSAQSTRNNGASGAYMTGRSLESINSETFDSLDKSRTAILDLSINKIGHIQDEAFLGFHNLRILDLQLNALHTINVSTFSSLMTLEELDLSRNMISDFIGSPFRMMLHLRKIDLSENCIFQLPNYLFFRNLRLIDINLSQNQMSSLPILFPATQYVANLNLTWNYLTNMTSLAQYNNIQSLDLSYNPFSPEEMATSLTDVVEENDSSSESDENDNYLNAGYETDAKHTHHPSSPTRQRYGNRARIDFSPDVNSMGSSRARRSRNTESVEYNSAVQYLMDTFRPSRTSEEALQALIKSTMKEKSEDFKVDDMKFFFESLTNYYHNQRTREFHNEMRGMKARFPVASFVQSLNNTLELEKLKARLPHRRYSPEQLQQIIKFAQTNHLERFTCRNCSLDSLVFLSQYPELEFVDVTSNKIKTVNVEQLKSCKNIRYLLASDNRIESLNFNSLLRNLPNLQVLALHDNPVFDCDLVSEMHYKVSQLNKRLRLEVNKCK